ncbi:hypothetical protein [Actinoallomurus sp. NPDC050550]|uniref:hypothetical protein n=1 Tax=Actinoallomurus sp. NPDC050550 TaxID=3154937 RepID=UPI0033C299C8
MTQPPDNTPDESEERPTFKQWLDEKGITETGEPKPPPASDIPDEQPPLFAPDVRAIGWTVPLGAVWLFGAYFVPHFSEHGAHTATRLSGLALIAWAIHLACELSLAYTLGDDYPRLGMWEWLLYPQVSRLFERIHKTANKAVNNGVILTLLAGLLIPGLYLAFNVFFTALSAALPLWVALLIITGVTHISVTTYRHHKRRNNAPEKP